MSYRYDPEKATGFEIAIVGMACRFPGARDVDQYWDNLKRGVDSFRELSDDEIQAVGMDLEEAAEPSFVRIVRAIEDPDHFDAAFFGISPKEAEVIDPQQRLMLECSWQALEHAGYDPQGYPGLVGVFAGTRVSSYKLLYSSVPEAHALLNTLTAHTGNEKDYVATRISYKLGLGGPSLTVQCACSTSLVAAHLAAQSLIAGECDAALAGGVSLRTPLMGYHYREGELYSKDGHVRAFDADASGTIFANGLGVVVLKRLEDAVADGDRIHAVMRGSAVNNDGSLKVGYTAPGADGQARVIRAAQIAADVDPATITYVEAHGTGTPTGDPIEVSALTRAFRETTDEVGFCGLGSVKTNIGHQSTAAGVASLIKTALAIEEGVIPPSLLFEKPNPQIDFESSPFYVVDELREWPSNGEAGNGSLRRAGVSAFGIGGTNAHAILEEPPAPEPTTPSREHQLVVLSARTATALDKATEDLAHHLDEHPELDLADVAFTLAAGRHPFEHRRTLVCRDLAEARAALAELDPKKVRTAPVVAEAPEVVFLFSGQGAQYPGMGRDLYRHEEIYREAVDRCAEILEPLLGRDLRELIHGEGEEAAAELSETRNTQPALFTVEYALAQLWLSWGVEPAAMIGHSIGEYVAAHLAGVFSLEDALTLVAERGRLMQSLPAGDMLSVPLTEEELRPRLDAQLSIAAINAPGRAVVSGPSDAIAALDERLRADGVASRPLHTSHAFHSPMMEPILPAFIEAVKKVELRAPDRPWVSNVSGTWITETEATDPEYWALHLRQAVRFADGLERVLESADRLLLEIGPGKTLVSLARRHPAREPAHVLLTSLRHPKDPEIDDQIFALDSLGQLWLSGAAIDWPSFYGGERRQRVILPTYPFERRRFTLEDKFGSMLGSAAARRRPERRAKIDDWFYLPSWQPSIEPAPLPAAGDDGGSDWLIFADRAGLADRLAQRLEELGHRTTRVEEGEGFAELGEGRYALSPGEAGDYEELFDALGEAGRQPARIAHLWALTPEGEPSGSEPGDPGGALDATQERTFWSLLALAQSLGKRGGETDVHLAVVSNRLHPGELFQPAAGGGALDPAKATLLGPCRVIGSENPRIAAMSVDVVWPGAREALEATTELVEALLAEVEAPESGAVVAYRHGERWARDYREVPVGEALPAKLRVRDGGCYLITGGLGGFGLTFAEYLAREHGARLALLSRSELPPRADWESWIAEHGPEERTSRRLGHLLELEALGAEVLPLSADVGDAEALSAAVAGVRERFGELHGVIHAAGLPGGGMMQLKTREAAAAVLEPKVRGTLALERALGGEKLDFFVLASSTIAVLGTFGQVDYCAANNFLDAWAEARAARGDRSVVSINWGAWREVGMAVETPPPSAGRSAATPSSVPALPALEGGREVDHPFIDRRLDEDGDISAYLTDWDAERHWVLDEHRIMETPAVPGTTWLELARAAYAEREAGDGPVEVCDVFFSQPLMAPVGAARRGRIQLVPESAGRYRFKAESRGAGEADWTLHTQGKVGRAEPTEAGRCDLEAILERCPEKLEIVSKTDAPDATFVHWGPRWQSLREIYMGEKEALCRFALPEEFADDCRGLELHPALVDVATAMISSMAEGDNYLPLSYRRVVVHAPLPAEFWSHTEVKDEDAVGAETVHADLTFLDLEGRVLVSIERFTMKRVGQARERLRDGGPAPAAKPAREGLFAEGGMSPAQGVEVLRRVLSRSRWPRVVVSPRDLGAMLLANAEPELEAPVTAAPRAAGADPENRHPRPHLTTPYTEPTHEVERQLCAIWGEVLGVDKVGIHDNFFDLGGDSVLGINVLSQAAELGLEMRPEQLFEHQTVAELARSLGEGEDEELAVEAEVADDADEGEIEAEELEKILGKLQEIS